MAKIVAVVNSYGRPIDLVEKSLNSILMQSVKPEKLIFIDQNSTPLILPENIRSNPLLVLQKTSENSVSGARNQVQIPPGTDWLCFCDDDGVMAPGYFEKLQKILSENRFDVIAGGVLREDTLEFYSLRHKVGGNMSLFRNAKLLMGSNFCVRSALFDQVDRFDTRFGAGTYWGSSEETDFAWKCYFAGARMSFNADLQVIHAAPFNESLSLGFHKSFRYARGKGAMVSKWLIEEKRMIVLHEALEMTLIPLIQFVRGIVTFKASLSINNMGVLVGRWLGLISFPFHSKKGS